MKTVDLLLNARTKGLPGAERAIPISEIGGKGWNVLREDMPLPLAVLRDSALDNNSQWMRSFLERTGALLAPHGKTSMAPALFQRQIDDGAWGITLATMQQLEVAHMAGVRRVLLANELVGRRDIDRLFQLMKSDPDFEVMCLVDSTECVCRLAEGASRANVGRPLELLLELGMIGGRAGCRDMESALAVARAVADAAPQLTLRGTEGFEGLLQSLPVDEAALQVADFLGFIVTVTEKLDAESLFTGDDIVMSAGGSSFFDLVVDVFKRARLSRPSTVILRSGCYLTHDAGLYSQSFADMRNRSEVSRSMEREFENALEVWAYVISTPEPGRVILNAGRRDFGHDAGMPTPLLHYRPSQQGAPRAPSERWRVAAVNDQHCHLMLPPGADLAVGDMIALGVSHPCTTFDKWRVIAIVDDQYNVIGAIETFF